MLTTGEGLLVQEDGVTNDDMQRTFQTNLFGHYLLVCRIFQIVGA